MFAWFSIFPAPFGKTNHKRGLLIALGRLRLRACQPPFVQRLDHHRRHRNLALTGGGFRRADLAPQARALADMDHETLLNPPSIVFQPTQTQVGTNAAVANAVCHAIGVRIRGLPIRLAEFAQILDAEIINQAVFLGQRHMGGHRVRCAPLLPETGYEHRGRPLAHGISGQGSERPGLTIDTV